MRSTHLPTIAKVRLLAGAIGEHAGWWPTQFTFEASRRSLEMVFPNTAMRAALESVTEAARRVHDEPLSPMSFHLFRLPIHLEDRLAGWLARSETSLSWPSATLQALLAELARTASSAAPPVPQGPQRLGEPARLNHKSAFEDLAAAYLHAARGGFRVLPYFEA
jgi:hypothetical protein